MALTTIQPYNINTVATFSFTDLAATDVSATGNVEVTGNVSGDYFIGNGSSLTHLTGANVTGEVDYAATANSVAVANVTGIGNIATINLDGNAGNILYGNGVFSSAPNVENANTANYASTANSVTGSNVSGEVSYAATANSVAGANVSGQVSYAAVANSVSVANVSGIGNIATINKDGNSSNILYGNGIFASAPVTYGNSNVATFLGSYGSNTITTTGNISVGNIIGNGQALTGLNGANVTGAVQYATTANSVAGANVSGEVTYAATANSVAGANVTGTVSSATTAGTVTTAAQPNITSVGTLSSLTSTGNIQTSGNIVTDLIVGRTTGVTITAAGTNTDITLVPNGTGSVNVSNVRITNVGVPTQSSDAATKDYVDSVAQGLHTHDSCIVATTGTLASASGGSTTYNNGSSGVGATITTTGTYNLIDGANVQTVGTRILVKNEANAAWNGIYTYTNTTTLTRSTDFDTTAEAIGGDFVFVTSGSTLADTGWVQTTDNPILGTDNIVWTQFSGAGTYAAGTGLTLTGTTFSITDTTVTAGDYGNGDRVASFSVNGQGQITSASSTVITANAANLSGTTLKSTIVNSSLTSVGTLSSLSVSGNATVGNIIGTHANGNSNVSIPSEAGNVAVSVNGNANILIVTGTGINVSGTLNATGNANVGNIGATGFYGAATGLTSIPGGNVTGAVPYATTANSVAGANVSGAVSYATTANSVAAANVSGTVSSATTAGTVTTAAQPNITSTGTLTSVNSSGNVTAPNVVANTGAFYGSGAGLSSIPAGNLTGTIDNARVNGQTYTINITGSAGTAGTVTTAAQPNITSTGTLTSVSVSGVATLPKINVNRSSGNTTGITWYSSGYSAWTDYMSPAGATSCGPYGNITAPSGNLVTNWGLRSFIEDSSGYGWTWESGSAQQTTPTIKAEIRSSDGSFRNTGNIYCVGDVITNYSDINLKDIIGPIENAVEKVCAIETFYYRPNQVAKDLGVADELQVGVSAQSVKRVAEETTRPSPINDKYLTVMYERLVPYLIESIKEHEKTIQDLKEQINSLKGK